MWSLARGIAQYSLKNSREYPKTSGAIPRFLNILSRLFVNILQSTLANLHILLHDGCVGRYQLVRKISFPRFPIGNVNNSLVKLLSKITKWMMNLNVQGFRVK